MNGGRYRQMFHAACLTAWRTLVSAMDHMRHFVAFCAAATLMGSSAPGYSGPAAPVIGYVNLQRAILEVNEGRRAKAALKKTFDKKQKVLSKRETELKALKAELDKESAAKDGATTRQRYSEFQNKYLELQQVLYKEQQELQSLEQKELAKITEKMKKIIRRVGENGKYTLILEIQENRLLYAQTHLDLTNEIIRKYNNKHK